MSSDSFFNLLSFLLCNTQQKRMLFFTQMNYLSCFSYIYIYITDANEGNYLFGILLLLSNNRSFYSLTMARIVIRSSDQNWNIGGGGDEVWNGWSHVESKDNFWGCGNNIGMTLQKGMNVYQK